MVFDRGATDGQLETAAQQPGGFCRLAFGVLDRLGLIEDHIVELEVAQLGDISADSAVRGNDQVVVGERFAKDMTARAGIVKHAKPRGELGGLLHPVEDQRAWDDRQGRSLGLAMGPPPLQERQNLNRLAEAHIVGQNAAETESLKIVEPAQSLALIGAQLAVEARGRIDGHYSLKLPQVLPDLLEGVVDQDFGLRGQKRIKHARLRRAEAKAPVGRGRQVGEHSVLLQPLFGEHSHRAVTQLDHRLAAPGGRQEIGEADVLVAVKDTAGELKPVDAGCQRHLELAGRTNQLSFRLNPPTGGDQVLGHL